MKQGYSPADLLDHCNNINETPEFSDSNANTDELVNEKKISIKDPNEINSSNSSTVDVKYVLMENESCKNVKTIENKPLPRRKGLACNDPSQGSIVTMFNAMKRKLTPGKEEDTTREHKKIQRNESTNL